MNWRWVLRLGLLLLALSILPVILGILIDWRLHTSPIVTLFMMFLGFNVGIFTIARSAAEMYSHLTVQDSSSHRVGGD